MTISDFLRKMGRYPTSVEVYLCREIDALRTEVADLRREVRAAHYPPLPDDSPLQRAFEVHRNTPYEYETTAAIFEVPK